jgi:hypothetical protein
MTRTISRALTAASLLVAVVGVALPAGAGPGVPVTWFYPSSCGGAVTLQQCIDTASPGDTIRIDDPTPIDEYPLIQKSLNLLADTGVRATILQGLFVGANAGTIAVDVRDITFEGSVRAGFIGGANHSVTFEDLRVSATPTFGAGIEFTTTVPAVMRAIGNTVHDAGNQRGGIEFAMGGTGGYSTMLAVGNTISSKGIDDSSAGITMHASGSGSLWASAYGNSVWRTGACMCGGAAGLFVTTNDTVQMRLNVVGNTFVRNPIEGIAIHNDVAAGGELIAEVYDNVLAHVGRAVSIDDAAPAYAEMRFGHNAFFDTAYSNRWDGYDEGAGNVRGDPRFTDEPKGKLELLATSPLVDAGLVCTAGGLENLDALGHGRLAGASVDIGAYERGAVEPTGLAVVGTGEDDALLGSKGDDIICGLGGGDILAGFEGRDWLDGGGGPDQVTGHDGRDRIFGGKGSDPCLHSRDGVEGNDRIDGGTGIDGVRRDPGDVKTRVEAAAVCS